MKKCRFTEEKIISILREADAGVKVVDLCRKHGMSDAAFYKWKARYGGLDVSQLRRLKRMYAELSLAHQALQDAVEKRRAPTKSGRWILCLTLCGRVDAFAPSMCWHSFYDK